MAAGYVLSMVFGTPKKFRAQDIVSRIAAALAPKISAKYQDNEGGRRTAGIVFLLSLIAVTVLPAEEPAPAPAPEKKPEPARRPRPANGQPPRKRPPQHGARPAGARRPAQLGAILAAYSLTAT